MKIILSNVLLAVLLLSAATLAFAQDAEMATLAWKLEKGDLLEVQFDQTQSVLTRIDARDRTLQSEVTLFVDWNVKDVDANGDATIEQTLRRIRVKTGTPGAEVKKVVDLDTGSEQRLRGVSRDVMKQMKTLVGLKFTVVMSPNGKVVSVTPADEVDAVVGALPETSALKRMFSAQSFKRLVSDSAFLLPGEAVGKGDTWSEESEIKFAASDGRTFPMKRTVRSTLSAIDSKQANIDLEIDLTQSKEEVVSTGNELTSPLELTGFSGKGTMSFNRTTGTITSCAINSETKTRVIYREDQVKTTISVANKLTVKRK